MAASPSIAKGSGGKKDRALNPIVKYWLLLFNAGMFAVYAFIFVTVATAAIVSPDGALAALARAQSLAGDAILLGQALAFLELLHAVMGWVKSGLQAVVAQLLARNVLLFAVLAYVPEVRDGSFVFGALLLVWSGIEVIRYPFYGLKLVGACPYFLVWARYTAFLPLYPAGLVLEVYLWVSSLPFIAERRIHAVDMPNPLNFAFDFYYCVVIILLLILPGFWGNYTYMIRARSKALGGRARGAPGGKKSN